MNYYEHHIGDYAAATGHLSLVEDAIYSRLLRRYYLQEQPLPADVAQVARLCGARAADEVAAVEVVLHEFFQREADGWHNKRADEEIARYQDKQAKARASAEARWGRDAKPSGSERNAPAMRPHSEGNAHQTPDTNTSTSLRSVEGARRRAAPPPACPDGVDPQTWADWLALRRAKKAPVTATVLRGAHVEAVKAGMSLEQFLRVWCSRGSQGLQADWLKPHERAGPAPPQRQEMGKTAQALMALEDFGNGGLDQAGNRGGAEALDVPEPGADAGRGGHSVDRRRLA